MVVCDHYCVILQIKKGRCALNKKILDLLNRKKFLEHAVVELVYDFNEKFTVSV